MGRRVYPRTIVSVNYKLEGEPVSLNFHSVLSKLYTEPSIGASYQISVHLAIRFQRRRFFFRNQAIRNNNCLWWPCLLLDLDKMSNLHRWPSMDPSYQVSIHLAKRFQIRRFKNIGQSETRIAGGSHVC
jgi:hypothetical protein